MNSKEKLQEKTVVELKEQAAKKGIPGYSTMTKDELVDHLSDEKGQKHEPIASFQEDEPKKSAKGKSDKKDQPQRSGIGVNIIGDAGSGKNPKRLFQTGPDTKEYLTKEEAENPPEDDDGKPTRPKFYWKDLDEGEDPAKSDKTTLRA